MDMLYEAEIKFSLLDRCILIWCSIVLFVGLWVIYANVSFFNFYKNRQKEALQPLIGHVVHINGVLRRQLKSHAEFLTLHEGDALYQGDTIITQMDSTASILLDPKIFIDLMPNVMLRLVFFQSDQSQTAVVRVPKIEVISGEIQVKSESKNVMIQKKSRLMVLKSGKRSRVKVAHSPSELHLQPLSLEKQVELTESVPMVKSKKEEFIIGEEGFLEEAIKEPTLEARQKISELFQTVQKKTMMEKKILPPVLIQTKTTESKPLVGIVVPEKKSFLKKDLLEEKSLPSAVEKEKPLDLSPDLSKDALVSPPLPPVVLPLPPVLNFEKTLPVRPHVKKKALKKKKVLPVEKKIVLPKQKLSTDPFLVLKKKEVDNKKSPVQYDRLNQKGAPTTFIKTLLDVKNQNSYPETFIIPSQENQ